MLLSSKNDESDGIKAFEVHSSYITLASYIFKQTETGNTLIKWTYVESCRIRGCVHTCVVELYTTVSHLHFILQSIRLGPNIVCNE